MKYVWKILFVIIFIILIFLGIKCVEYLKLNFGKKDNSLNISQVFPTLEEEKSDSKYKKLEDINSKDLDLSDFIESKYYTLLDDGIVYHKKEMDKFIQNVNLNVSDQIRIIQYVREGVLIKDIEFNKDKYIVKTDNRWCGDNSVKDKKITTVEYDAKKYKIGIDNTPYQIESLKKYYKINLNANDNSEIVYLCDYIETNVNDTADFELEFNKDTTKGKETILLESENTKYDYNIYSYNGDVNVIINGEKIPLREALLNNKITVEQILEKANKEASGYKTIYVLTILDGGSKEYFYDDYTILKLNTISGNRDLYIGNPSMNINDVK